MDLAGLPIHRFWAKVDKHGPAPAHRPQLGPCWIWTGCTNKDGYGFWRGSGNGQRKLCHCVSWVLENGAIPDGMQVLHSCDNPPCVRPFHLWLGTIADNMRDRAEKGRSREQRGSKNASTKLTEADVVAMREAFWNEAARLTELGTRYGVHFATVSYIVNGHTWTHVPMPAGARQVTTGSVIS